MNDWKLAGFSHRRLSVEPLPDGALAWERFLPKDLGIKAYRMVSGDGQQLQQDNFGQAKILTLPGS